MNPVNQSNECPRVSECLSILCDAACVLVCVPNNNDLSHYPIEMAVFGLTL